MGISSISLIGDSAMELDALTTAVFVSGIREGYDFLNKYHLQGILVSKDMNVMITQGLQDKFAFLEEKELMEYEEMVANY
jgi:thiamine biosynthesis lipoprotein